VILMVTHIVDFVLEPFTYYVFVVAKSGCVIE